MDTWLRDWGIHVVNREWLAEMQRLWKPKGSSHLLGTNSDSRMASLLLKKTEIAKHSKEAHLELLWNFPLEKVREGGAGSIWQNVGQAV